MRARQGLNVAGASIWVDADACPKVIKEILFRAAERTGVSVTLVANQPLLIPRIPGRSAQPPRTINSISTPACEAAYSA